MFAVDAADAAARRSAAADRQDEHGGVARVPRAAARSRAGRARGAHAGGDEDSRRPAQARDEERRCTDVLPPDILERKKRGFGTPMGAWLKGELAPLLRDLLSETIGQGARPVPTTPAIAAPDRRRTTRNRTDGTDRLLALLNLEIWARIYLDGRAPIDVADELKARRREDPLRLPSLPVSPEARRQDPAVQHDPAPVARARGDGRVARALRTRRPSEGEGLAPYCAHYRDGPRSATGADAAHGRAAADADAVVDGLLLLAAARAPDRRHCSPGERFDLIFVHCSSVAQYVEHVRGMPKILDFGDMDSQKWLEYARYKPFPLSLGYWLEGTKAGARGKASRAPLRPVHGDDARRMGRRSKATARASRPTGSPTASTASTSHRRASLRSGYDRVRRTHGLLPEPGVHVRVLRRTTLPLLQARARRCKLLIVGADPSPRCRRLAELPGVTVTGRCPTSGPILRRSALMVAPLNIARGTQNKILEAMAMGVPVVTSRVAAGGVDASSPEHFLVASTPEDYVAAILRIARRSAERRRARSRRPRSACCRTTHWDKSMQRLDGIIERCLSLRRASVPRGARTCNDRSLAVNISIFGLGYVGAVSLACLARDGHRVVGVDVDQAKLDLIAAGKTPVVEEGMVQLMADVVASGRVSVTRRCPRSSRC